MLKDKLKQARLENNYKQSEFAKLLGVKNTTISNWETGVSNPDVELIEKICRILNVSASFFFDCNEPFSDLSPNEMYHINCYRKLDAYGKKQVSSVLENEYQRVKEQTMLVEEYSTYYSNTVIKTEYLTSLSAGTGLLIFDDIPTKPISIPCKYDFIDFVIGVSGDSMEPTYHNGDRIMVVKQAQLQYGEIGVFMIDGNGYIKEYSELGLISHNKDYPIIPFDSQCDIYCIGKVIGVV